MSIQEPFYFGPESKLFGLYHAADGPSRKDAVLIVGPLLSESMRAHFALRQVALKLASRGHDVLRFDFVGMGNSLKSSNEVHLSDWTENVKDAATELIDITGATNLRVISVRFGAGLAFTALEDRPVGAFISWDPILSGESWLNSLKNMSDKDLLGVPGITHKNANVFSGQEMSEGFESELIEFRTATPQNHPLSKAVLTGDSPSEDGVSDFFSDLIAVPFRCDWESRLSQVLYPHQVIDSLVENV